MATSAKTPDLEIKVQDRVKHWLIDELGYTYLGNLRDTENTNIREKELRKHLVACGYSKEHIDKAIAELVKRASARGDLYQRNMEFYSLLRYGCQGIKDGNGDRQTVHFIDWAVPSHNDFYVAEEVTVCREQVENGERHKRPDLILYINGIALGMIELKRSIVSVGEGIAQMLTNQKEGAIRSFFNTMQLLMAGNESQGLQYGVICTPQKKYLAWKEDAKATDELSMRIKDLREQDSNRLREGIVSLCQPERFISLIYDFMIFDAGVKKTARPNQYFANLAARKRIIECREEHETKGGIIWNTQGSGKSLIMVWLTKWIIENIDNSRVVIITDRDELDDQIESLFIDVGEKVKRAKSCEDLRNLLNHNDDPIICSLIHKYGHNAGKQADIDKYVKELLKGLPKDYKAKGNIIAFIDECHRTNSGKLHEAVKQLMPDAVLIGFTGTPLLKTDKKTSLEIFGTYIHTYKFNEGIEDGVVLDLRYEARDVDQDLSSKERIDQWFEMKTEGLTERARIQLKQTWTTMNKLYSSKERLERIVDDIMFDMMKQPRLKTERGTAMLVANSIYEACKYWELFVNRGLTQCAIVTSYEPTAAAVRTATTDLTQTSEEEYKKKIYERMLGGKSVTEFEADVKKLFKESPAKMKLLIVVDKLLTGFDAPSATYLYIDKSMRDHDLFQAICRVNRPDGDDKDYGYIVDYMDLFRNIQSAVKDYTSEAFSGYDKEDVEDLIKNRYDEAKAEMDGSLASLTDMLGGINAQTDTDYIDYFCGDNSEDSEMIARRDAFYALVASLSRSFASCCNKLVSDYGYTDQQVEKLRNDISNYNRIKEMIKLASCDYIDQKPYEADMRYILDTYIRAQSSKVVNSMEDMTLVELLLEGKTTTPVDTVRELPGDDRAKAETIENNLQHEIVKKMGGNAVYYGKLSDMLNNLVQQRKAEAISYEEYLKQVVALAKAILHPEDDDTYPESVRDSAARRMLYDYFDSDEDLANEIDSAIKNSSRPGWHSNKQKRNRVRNAIADCLVEHGYTDDDAEERADELLEKVKGISEYDK